jgi:hypothetical protein
MNKAVYSCILGPYDDLKEPTIKSEGWDYIMYTDQDFESDIWEIRKIQVEGDPQRLARKIKILFHEYIEHEESLWLDAAFHIRSDLNLHWNKFYHEPFCVPEHPLRNCIYREIESCIANGRGNKDELIHQRETYRKEGVKPLQGIITSGVMMRNRKAIELCQDWYQELGNFSVRDQVAFARVTQRKKYDFWLYRWDYSQSKDLKYTKHLKYR